MRGPESGQEGLLTGHGLGGYTNHGCRCDICKQAAVNYVRNRRSARRAVPVPEHVHGTDNGYTNYACRCDRCKLARSELSALARKTSAASAKRKR